MEQFNDTYISVCEHNACEKKDTCRRYVNRNGTVIKFKNICRPDNENKYYIYYLEGLVMQEEDVNT